MNSCASSATQPSEITTYEANAIRDAFRDSRPRNAVELYNYIRAFIRNENDQPVVFGHTAVCKGHNSPFAFVKDAFFGTHRLQIVHAARTTGKTLGQATVQFLEQYFDGYLGPRIPYRSLTIGAVQRQADTAIEIATSIWNQDEYLYALKSKDLSVGTHKTQIQTSDGSTMKTTVATMNGVNSPHVPKLTLDELDLWDPVILKQAKSIPKAAGNHSRAIRLLSTMKFASGVMSDAMDNAAARGYKSYTWCIFEALEKCPPERKCKECPLYEWGDKEGGELCGGRAKFSTGHFPIDESIEIFRDQDRETLESEWLCLKPDRQGLVYGRNWRPAEHFMPFEIPYNNMLPFVLGIDQGWTNPFGVLYFQEDKANEQTRIIGEEYLTHTLPVDMGLRVGSRLYAWGVPTSRPLELIYDAEDPAGAKEFARNLWTDSSRNVKYRARLRHPGKINVLNDLRHCRQALKSRPGRGPGTIVSNTCPNFKHEMGHYKYPTKSNANRPTTENPIPKDDHLLDTWRRFETIRRRSSGKGKTSSAPDLRN